MSDNAVTERRVRPIQDALAAGNFKQALKECEKWQKKGESSDRFLALKAAVLTQQSDLKQKEKGKAETLSLCRREPAVVNVEALHQLQSTLRNLSLEIEETPKLWERAVATRSNDKDLMVTWLTGSISAGSWQSAQKATMSLRKAFPKERHYEFWNILICYLIHKDPKASEKDRTLFGTLANRMISKAASSIPSEKGLSNPEELSLWASILCGTGNAKEVAQQLQSEAMEPIVQQDPQLAFSLLLEALGQSNDTSDIISLCNKTLFSDDVDESKLNDDRVWNLRGRTTTTSEQRNEFVKNVDKLLDKHPDCKPAYLARLDILSQLATEKEENQEKLFQACKAYYDRFGLKAFCFDDLIDHLKILGATRMTSFLDEVSKDATEPMQHMFALKLMYNDLSSGAFSVSDMESFAAEALDLHEKLPQSTTSCPEAALLAALALVQIASKSGKQAYALQACMILHTSFLSYPEYYPLCVLLLQLQRSLALMSLSISSFYKLSIKNLQWETIGSLLLTRISSLHPWRSDLEPLGFLDAALHVFESADRSLDRSLHEGLKHGSYSNITDTVRVRRNLHYSLCRQLYAIEERKTQRICGIPVPLCLDIQGGDLIDLRDLSFMPTYGLKQSYLQDSLQCGPDPNHSWVHSMAEKDHLTTYLIDELGGQASQTAEAITALKKERDQRAENHDDMTTAERRSAVVVEKLGAATILQIEGSHGQQADFDSHLESVQNWLEKPHEPISSFTVDDLTLPFWDFLHSHFTVLETLQLVAVFLGVQSKRAKAAKGKTILLSKERIGELQQLITAAEKTTHEQAMKLKEGLNAPGVLGKLVDAVLGRAEDNSSEESKALWEKMESLQSEAAVEELCGSLKDSWADALDGILAIKVKLYK